MINLEGLQNYMIIVNFVKGFEVEVIVVKSFGERLLFFGEINFVICGGGGILFIYGVVLWIVDYVFQSVKFGYERFYFY